MFIAGTIMQIFIYSYMGNILLIKSDELYEAMLNVNWYQMNRNEQRSYCFIFQNVIKPIEMTAMIYPLNLEIFVKVF